ncbi:MAG TPA: transglycosylase SLT domain-containing protein, partial [Rugosimonospora sp.]|nr:transglycosylase SLT domain-containing protein [Rugosimonospora sp.]
MAWAPVVEQALRLTGAPMSWLNGLLSLMAAESGGNPNAINGWDINAKNGVPSQGLMQVIPPTFAAYHQPGTSNNILDPLANIAAAINYIKARYGYVPGSPYALGTPGATSGVHLVGEQGPELVNFRGGETVTPAKATAGILSGSAMGGLDVAGMLQGALTSGGTPGDMLAQFEQIVAAAQQMATSVQGSWMQVTGTATSAQAGLAPVVQDIVTKHQQEIPAAMATMTAANSTAWTQMSTDANTQWAAQRDTTFAEAGVYMGTTMPTWGQQMNTGVSTAWSDMATATSESWTSMEQGTAEPVNWIISNSYNSGIAAMWNAVAGVIWEGGGKELPSVATLATGGPVHGPGTATSDSIPAMLSRGEHVLTAREVQKAGGHQAIYRMRAGLMSGEPVMGFAAGGAVDGELKRGALWPAIEGGMKAAVDSTKSQFGDIFGRTSASADILSPADWIEQYVKKDDEINKFVGGPPWIPGVSDQITSFQGFTVNQRTADMLNAAMELGASFSLFQG